MEINSLGYINIDDYRMSSVNSSQDPRQNFEEILRRTQTPAQSEVKKVSTGAPIDKNDRLYELCLELETFIVKTLITGMRNTVQKSGLVDDSFAGKMYEDMLYDEYAKDFTKNAGFGLAEQAYRQLSNYY